MDKKEYCTQNDGDCESCSLVNYGRDCQNNPISEGEENENRSDLHKNNPLPK